MVHRELWATVLAYNLIRITSAYVSLQQVRYFTTDSLVKSALLVHANMCWLASWMQLSSGQIGPAGLDNDLMTMLKQIACGEVANRPGRLKPCVLKRRRHRYPLMMESRNDLRRELRKRRT